MSVTLIEILMLVGRLDDEPGVESPSQRFRRFLTERVTDVREARTLIEQCQGAHGEIERRVLQDLIVFLGRFLGFEVIFGCYEPIAGILDYHGHWRSPHNREVLADVRTDRTTAADLRSLSRSVAALESNSTRSDDAGGSSGAGSRPIGLSVSTPLYAHRARLEQAFHDRTSAEKLRLVSSPSLVTLAELVSTGRVTHAEVLRLFESSIVLDPFVEMLDRSLAMARPEGRPLQAVGDGLQTVPRMRFWLATIVSHGKTPPERVTALVRQRQMFRLTGEAAESPVQPLDWICFCVPGTGVVGHAQVASVSEEPVDPKTGPGRSASLLHLQGVRLYPEAPASPGFQTQLRVTAAYTAIEPDVVACLPLSEDEFNELIRPIPQPAAPQIG
jgi:hypothetical protein